MYLKTKGKPTKVPIKLCKEASKWYGRYLLGDKLYHNIELILDFSETDMSPSLYGYCEWNDTNDKARSFTITINPVLGKRNMLLALAHEMVHVKQYARGEMKNYIRMNKVKWMGKIYDGEEIDYWEHPWEIDAHGREKGLYYKFLDSQRGL